MTEELELLEEILEKITILAEAPSAMTMNAPSFASTTWPIGANVLALGQNTDIPGKPALPIAVDTNGNIKIAGGGGVVPGGGTTAQFLRGDLTWSNTLTGPTLLPVGSTAFPSMAFATAPNTGFRQYASASGTIVVVGSGVDVIALNTTGVLLDSTAEFGWTSSIISASVDTSLSRTGPGTVAIGNGTAGDFTGSLKLNTISVGVGSATTPSINFSTSTNTGFHQYASASGTAVFTGSGIDIVALNTSGVTIHYQTYFGWASSTIGSSVDTGFARLGPGSVVLGTGAAGDFSGSLKLTAIAIGGALTAGVSLQIPIAPTATANYGLISIGGGPWDGSTSGFFAGNANGTHLAFNTVSGFAGRIIDARQAGVRQFAIGIGSVTSATSAVLNGVDIAPFTYTITGSAAITTATGFNAVQIGIPTYSAASAVAITIGSTFTVLGAPVVAGSATLTTPLSVWVQGGTSRFDGNITLSTDNTLQRLGAHSLQFGAANNSAPVSYTLTGGESARGGTDTNTVGGSLTIASGLGTGTGAVSSIVFQTPTVGTTGTTAQTLGTRLTVSAVGAVFGVQVLARNGIDTNGIPNQTINGFVSITLGSYNSESTTIAAIATGSLRIGAGNSATPVANKLTIGESSRGGTDSNVAGANGTIQSGLGTGTGALTSLVLASSKAAASGTTAQTYVTGLTILAGTAVLTNYIVANLPDAATAGVGATAFVTDASTTVILGLGQAVVGSGSNKVPVYCDGSSWIIG